MVSFVTNIVDTLRKLDWEEVKEIRQSFTSPSFTDEPMSDIARVKDAANEFETIDPSARSGETLNLHGTIKSAFKDDHEAVLQEAYSKISPMNCSEASEHLDAIIESYNNIRTQEVTECPLSAMQIWSFGAYTKCSNIKDRVEKFLQERVDDTFYMDYCLDHHVRTFRKARDTNTPSDSVNVGTRTRDAETLGIDWDAYRPATRTYGANKTIQAKGFLRNPDSKLRIPSDDDLLQLNGTDDMCVERIQSDIDIIKKTPLFFNAFQNSQTPFC